MFGCSGDVFRGQRTPYGCLNNTGCPETYSPGTSGLATSAGDRIGVVEAIVSNGLINLPSKTMRRVISYGGFLFVSLLGIRLWDPQLNFWRPSRRASNWRALGGLL